MTEELNRKLAERVGFRWWLLKFRLRRRWFNWRINRCLRREGMPTIQELAKLGEDKEAQSE